MNIKRFSENWFKYVILFLLIIRIIIIIFEMNQLSYIVDHRNPGVFFDDRKKKDQTEDYSGLDISLIKFKLLFPKIYSQLHPEKNPDLLSEINENGTNSFSKYNLPENRIIVLSYGKVSNDIITKYVNEKNDNVNRKQLKKTITKLLKKNTLLDSLEIRISFKKEIYSYFISKTKGYSLFSNNLSNQQDPKSLSKVLSYIFTSTYLGLEAILLFLALAILSFYIKIKNLKTRIEILSFTLILLHLFPMYYIKSNFPSLVNFPFSQFYNLSTWSLINLIVLNIHLISNPIFKYLQIIPLACIILLFIFPSIGFTLVISSLILFITIGTIRKKSMSKFRKIVYKKWDNLAIPPFIRIGIYFIEIIIIFKVIYPGNGNLVQELNNYFFYIFCSIIFFFFGILCVGPATIFNIDLKKYIFIKRTYYFFIIFSMFISIIWILFLFLKITPNMILIFLTAYLLTKGFFTRYRFYEPIKFDSKSELSEYLVNAFKQLSILKLYEYTEKFLALKFSGTNFAFISGETKFGFDFKDYFEAINYIPKNQKLFNLDIERSNLTDKSKKFSEEPDQDEIKLFFPLQSDKKNKSFFVAGSSSKLFWIKEEVDFIHEVMKIFQNALDTINLNLRFRDKHAALEKEKEKALIQKEYSSILENKNNQLAEEKQKILSSIQYASLIQNSILPRETEISEYVKDFFTIWKPKDIVGGDFYWFFPISGSQNYIISVIDCTGHGVPGAFMSMTANSILNNIVREKKIYEPDKILNLLHKEIRFTLRQQSQESQQDGMDISICYVDAYTNLLHFSGAMQSLFLLEADTQEITRIRGNRFSIGGKQKEIERIFKNNIIHYSNNGIIYLISDGFADQKVQIDGKETKLKTRRVKEILLKYCSLPMNEQKERIEGELAELQGDLEQRDDITLIGLRF